MAVPTLVASYSTDYTTAGTSKSVSVTCQAGDAFMIYAIGEKSISVSAPSATGVIFKTYSAMNGDSTYGLTALYYALFQPAATNLFGEDHSRGDRPWAINRNSICEF
jgi:hypothetical protein